MIQGSRPDTQTTNVPSTEPPRYDPETDTYHAGFDPATEESVSIRVVEVVAAVADAEPHELEPLFDSVDPDALDRIFEPRAGTSLPDGEVSFAFDDYAVTVYSQGEIVVSPL